MKVSYLPIDERPCNVDYIEMIAGTSTEVELLLPEKSLIGYKKKAADTEGLWNWLLQTTKTADALIL
jgi:hypothetical protein